MDKTIQEKLHAEKQSQEFKANARKIYEDLLNDLQSGNQEEVNNAIEQLTPDQLDALMQEAQPYKTLGVASSSKQVLTSVANLREQYYKKLLTTSLVGFLYQIMKEYKVKESELSNPINEDDFLEDTNVIEDPKSKHDRFYKKSIAKFFAGKYPNSELNTYKDMECSLSDTEKQTVIKMQKVLIEKFKYAKFLEFHNDTVEEYFKSEYPDSSITTVAQMKKVFKQNDIDNVKQLNDQKVEAIHINHTNFYIDALIDYYYNTNPNGEFIKFQEIESLLSKVELQEVEDITKSDLEKEFHINETKIYNETVIDYFQKKYPELADPNDKSYVDNVKDMEAKLSDNDLLNINKSVNDTIKELTKPAKVINKSKLFEAVQNQIDQQSDSERLIIRRFLDKFFKYDPLEHIQMGQHPIIDDPERKDNVVPQSQLEKDLYDNVPPNDTYCRFTSFYEVNYDKLREVSENLYNIKPDLELAMIVYDTVDTTAEVENFVHKYGMSSKFGILNFPLNQWALLGPFKENRDRVDYYHKHNSIIKSMIEQQEKDAELGTDIMKKRIKTKKLTSERVFGPDSPEFAQYKKYNQSELESKYGLKMIDMDDGSIKVTKTVTVDATTNKVLKTDDEGTPDNALDVDIININAKTGSANKTRIFTKADN
jgi:hypothetical protein